MSVYRDKRSPYYQFDFQHEDHRFHGTTKRTTRKDAEKFEAEELVKAKALVKAMKRSRASLLIDDVADRLWNDRAQYDADPKATETNLARLIEYFGKAIRARRAVRREDVISHLLDQGYSNREILTECLTYGAAGMATTREFIVMAAWHLFEREDLRRKFLEADEPARLALLEEILRLEPVVGALYRRTERELKLEGEGGTTTIPAGALVKIDVRATNSVAAGACPVQLDTDRNVLASKASASLMSFGDGPHRCPGVSVALQETAIFLERLLRVPNVHLVRAPKVGWNPLISSYELRGALIAT